MCRMAMRWAVVLALATCSILTAQAVTVRSDFSGGLTGWNSAGDAHAADGSVRLGDAEGGWSALWTAYELQPTGSQRFCFDLARELNFTDELGTFPDTFFTTLYFVNDLSDFDLLTGQYDASRAVLDADYLGVRAADGSVVPGDGSVVPFERWCLDFSSAYRYVIPVFELFDGDFALNSAVWIDNVSFSSIDEPVVPEPLHLVALGLGLGGLLRRRRARREMPMLRSAE